jgi:hypothetical protein
MTEYARGEKALGECARSGRRMRRRDMVEDGYMKGMLVDPAWREPEHPQEKLPDVRDPIGIFRPAPELSKPAGEGTAAPALTFDATGKLV